MTSPLREPGLLLPAAFFAASGLLELWLRAAEAPRPLAFWPLWQAVGHALMGLLLAAGLLRRIALCRLLALVYCLAALVTWPIVLGFALAGAPFTYGRGLVIRSLFEFPACGALLPFLRSPRAAALYDRPLLRG